MTGNVEQQQKKRRRSLFNQALDVLCILLGIRDDDDAVVHHQIARATGIERCLAFLVLFSSSCRRRSAIIIIIQEDVYIRLLINACHSVINTDDGKSRHGKSRHWPWKREKRRKLVALLLRLELTLHEEVLERSRRLADR